MTVILHKYQQASLDANRDAQVEAVVSLLELPGNVLRYMRADRGRKRNAAIQSRLERSLEDFEQRATGDVPNKGYNSNAVTAIYDTRHTGTQPDLKLAEVDKEERSMLRCISLVREGHVGRAAKSLCQSGFLNPTDPKVLPLLKLMHP